MFQFKLFRIAQSLYLVTIICYHFTGCVARTCLYWHNFHTGRIECLLSELDMEMGLLRRTDLACKKGKVVVILVTFICWGVFVIPNIFFTFFMYCSRLNSYIFMMSPFHLWPELFIDWAPLRLTLISIQMVTHFMADTACAMGSALTFCFNLLLAYSFKQLRINMKNQMERHTGSLMSNYENSKTGIIDVDHFRLLHKRLIVTVQKWDKIIRPVIGCTVVFSFFSCIIYIYYLLYDSEVRTLVIVMRIVYLSVTIVVIVANLSTAAFLNTMAHSIVNVIHSLKMTMLQDTVHEMIKVNLFLSQATNDQIGLTLFGMIHIKRSNVFSVIFFFKLKFVFFFNFSILVLVCWCYVYLFYFIGRLFRTSSC